MTQRITTLNKTITDFVLTGSRSLQALEHLKQEVVKGLPKPGDSDIEGGWTAEWHEHLQTTLLNWLRDNDPTRFCPNHTLESWALIKLFASLRWIEVRKGVSDDEDGEEVIQVRLPSHLVSGGALPNGGAVAGEDLRAGGGGSWGGFPSAYYGGVGGGGAGGALGVGGGVYGMIGGAGAGSSFGTKDGWGMGGMMNTPGTMKGGKSGDHGMKGGWSAPWMRSDQKGWGMEQGKALGKNGLPLGGPGLGAAGSAYHGGNGDGTPLPTVPKWGGGPANGVLQTAPPPGGGPSDEEGLSKKYMTAQELKGMLATTLIDLQVQESFGALMEKAIYSDKELAMRRLDSGIDYPKRFVWAMIICDFSQTFCLADDHTDHE